MALKTATKKTKSGDYHKIRHGTKLLSKLNPDVVRQNCKWCERFFIELEEAIRGM